MLKYKYVEEFEINASPKSIYPYLQNANSLSEWFVGQVSMNSEKVYNFHWDNVNHFARLTVARLNKQVRFEFLDENQQPAEDPNYLDFRLQQSELTDATYLKVSDYSEMTEPEDLRDLWIGLIHRLREALGV
ncbi:MAG: ATPase [Microscillaceae bacterium]|nr:ATPase [Microscillaceae bacterium]